MKIKSLRLKNFKNIEESIINFKSNLSGIYGPNGTGKTAIIEAIEIISLYFNLKKTEPILLDLKKKINNLIMLKKDFMEIELIISAEDIEYRLFVRFRRNGDKDIFTEIEKFSYKEVEPRKKFKDLFQVNDDVNFIIPNAYFKSEKKEMGQYLLKELLNKNDISLKTFVTEFYNLNSYMSLVYKYATEFKSNIKLEEFESFIEHWDRASKTIEMIMVISLKEQALYNLDIPIPIKVHSEAIHGTITVNYGSKNVYPEEIVRAIESVIQQMKAIFKVIIPGAELKPKSEIVNVSEGKKEFSLEIFVEREGKQVDLKRESTGIIKLVSLLSALVYYVQDDEAIIVIDELDIHIFEYLLAIILEKMSNHAKGQLIFTAHNLLPMEKLNRNSIIISTKMEEKVNYTYLSGTSPTTNLRNKYLRSQNLWSEKNIEPLLINESALDLFLRKLVR